ncbi:MAG: twin-arginine translocation signal domain-containing protein [Anaerolineae bacterium]
MKRRLFEMMNSDMGHRRLSRRRFLKVAAAAGVSLAGLPILSACQVPTTTPAAIGPATAQPEPKTIKFICQTPPVVIHA